ncbi:MAG: tetratricopeptide repeat protein [Bryobacterales bacterium]|nr:tetratricopeptide repeat protein [Bryobacterales bacterium]
MEDSRHELAMDLFQQAYVLQMQGELETAVELYRKSIELYPTAEAYTFLGWTYSFQGRIDEAIEQCKNAILIDPTFGNPYNDIGAYMIGQGKFDEAIPWLEKATISKRYEAYHYPWYNLGRIYAAKEMFNRARECFEKSLTLEPRYKLAADALKQLRYLVQ